MRIILKRLQRTLFGSLCFAVAMSSSVFAQTYGIAGTHVMTVSCVDPDQDSDRSIEYSLVAGHGPFDNLVDYFQIDSGGRIYVAQDLDDDLGILEHNITRLQVFCSDGVHRVYKNFDIFIQDSN